MSDVRCEGWWEQDGFGRQPMAELLLRFESSQLVGSGVDIIGPLPCEDRLITRMLPSSNVILDNTTSTTSERTMAKERCMVCG